MRRLMICLFVLILFTLPVSAMALTVDQVIGLRNAGVSNETIARLIENEIKTARQGGVGYYRIKQKDGSQVVVYTASSPRGVVEYPLEQAYEGVGFKPFTRALGLNMRAESAGSSAKGGYTLHLASFKDPANAQRELSALKAKGVEARIQSVDIPGKGVWHRLLAGYFPEKSKAEVRGDDLIKKKLITRFSVILN